MSPKKQLPFFKLHVKARLIFENKYQVLCKLFYFLYEKFLNLILPPKAFVISNKRREWVQHVEFTWLLRSKQKECVYVCLAFHQFENTTRARYNQRFFRHFQQYKSDKFCPSRKTRNIFQLRIVDRSFN